MTYRISLFSSAAAASELGTGGMATKIQAAKAATNSGIQLVIASGTEKNAIPRILQGEEIGTLFVSRENRLQFRKRWLAFGAKVLGVLGIVIAMLWIKSQNPRWESGKYRPLATKIVEEEEEVVNGNYTL